MIRDHNMPEMEIADNRKFTRSSLLRDDFDMIECWDAAVQGDADAQDLLGDCYQYGWIVEENHAAAVAWYERAAEQGHAAAQRSLGWC